MDLALPPRDGDPIITQFKPADQQWELNDENINRIDPNNGKTILHNYCEHINTTPLEVYRYLIEVKGCDVNALDTDYDNTPIHYALEQFRSKSEGSIAALTYLLNQAGVDVNRQNLNGYTLLHLACMNVNSIPLEIFKCLVETHGGDVNILDNFYDTPIHSAVRNFKADDGGDVTILIYLLSLDKVQVNQKDPFGRLLSHFTCQYINTLPLDVFKYLIETKGCDMNLIDKNASSPIRYAFEQFNPLNGGDIAVLIYLLGQKSVNINKDRDGLSLLHRACQKINYLPLEIFKFLIEAMSCDVNARSFSGDTPLHYALRDFKSRGGGGGGGGGNAAILHYLLTQEGIDVTIKGRTGYSLLHVACQSINHLSLDVFKYLIETKGCDINVQDNHTCTPFFYALFYFNQHGDDGDDGGDGVSTILTYLFNQKNLNIHPHDFNGRTLLHFACFSGDRFVTFQRDTNRDCDKEEAQNGTLRSKIIEIVIQKYLQDVFDEATAL